MTQLLVKTEESPVLSIKLINDGVGAHAKGVLVVKSNVADAQVLVDQKPYGQTMVDGSKFINLPPGGYSITLTKPGFQNPPAQMIRLAEGNKEFVLFTLTPVQTKALLTVRSLVPGAAVIIDDEQIGVARANGSFDAELLSGSHAIAFQKNGYEGLSTTREFEAGKTTTIDAADLLLELGTLTISNAPATSSRISIRRDGDAQPRDYENSSNIALRPGHYLVLMSADGQAGNQLSIDIRAGKPTKINWNVHVKEKVAMPTGQPRLAQFVENSGDWHLDAEGWWTHAGGNHAWLRTTGEATEIDILRKTVKTLFVSRQKRIDFTVDYYNPENQISYALDDHTLRRRLIVDGATVAEKRSPHGMDNQPIYRIVIRVSKDHVSVSDASGKVIDDLKRSSPGTLPGKLGFSGDVSLVVAGNK